MSEVQPFPFMQQAIKDLLRETVNPKPHSPDAPTENLDDWLANRAARSLPTVSNGTHYNKFPPRYVTPEDEVSRPGLNTFNFTDQDI